MSSTVEGPAHSPLGPSASERWIPCPGSVLASEGVEDQSSIFADEGTFAHDVSEMIRVQKKSAMDFVGHKSECGRFIVDVDFAYHLKKFVDYVDQFEGDPFYEERVSYEAWVKGGFGTADDIRIDEGLCTVTDLKFGKGVKVFAKDNPQLKLYALGVFHDYGHLYDLNHFRLNIAQPRIGHFDEWEISAEDLLLWARDVVEPIAKIALEPGAPFEAGAHCRFCSIRDTCKTRRDWVKGQMLKDLDDLDSIRDPEQMTNEELGDCMDAIGAMRSWCNDIETRVLSETQAGRDVTSLMTGIYKMVAGRSTRKWKNEKAAEKALRGTVLKVKEILVAKLLSPTQAEKLLGKDHPALKDLIDKPPGKPKLAPGTDPRPSVKPDISELDD